MLIVVYIVTYMVTFLDEVDLLGLTMNMVAMLDAMLHVAALVVVVEDAVDVA